MIDKGNLFLFSYFIDTLNVFQSIFCTKNKKCIEEKDLTAKFLVLLNKYVQNWILQFIVNARSLSF